MHHKSRFKLIFEKKTFRSYRSLISWENHHTTRISPKATKSRNFLRMHNFQSQKNKFRDISVSSTIIVTTYPNYQSNELFYELLKANKQMEVTEERLDNYKAINAQLAKACGLARRQPVTGRQYVLMTNTRFRASGYALMIEEGSAKKLNSRRNFSHQTHADEKCFPQPTKIVNLL